MLRILFKVILTALIVVGVSEAGKRLPWIGAILAALPMTSILAMTWLYLDTGDVQKVSDLSYGILWAILPSLLFFVLLPIFLKSGLKFGWSMVVSCGVMFLGYAVYGYLLNKVGIKI